MPILKRGTIPLKHVTSDEEARALIESSRPHGAKTLSHIILSIAPAEPASDTQKPGIYYQLYWGEWSGISFWF